jgi:hypothetical protein
MIVDIGTMKKFPITPFVADMALSHSRGRETVRLLHDFDDTIFTWHPFIRKHPKFHSGYLNYAVPGIPW